jgi:hypothetical protein
MIASVLVIFLISIWSLATYGSYVLRKDLQRLQSEQQFTTTSFLAQEINQELESRAKVLETLAKSIDTSLIDRPVDLQRSVAQHLFL